MSLDPSGPAEPGGGRGIAPTLGVTDLRFAYRSGAGHPHEPVSEELFGGLTHDFLRGGLTALTGASGRGKSTLLYILGLLLTPKDGAVLLDGHVVSRLADSHRSALRGRSIGFVFQDAALDPGRTLLDSVREPAIYAGLPRKAATVRAEQLLDAFALGSRAGHRPGQISGGQAQRAALARALLNDPSIVLADEPTGNLDRDNATSVLHALKDVARAGRTVVIATHDPFVIDQADEVLVL